MFTGLIKEIGEIKSIGKTSEGLDIEVYSNKLIREIGIDDSVSINGVCQTVVSFDQNSFKIQAVQTTLEKTNFSSLKAGARVNMELALTLKDRLGGHLVQGHVNGIAEVKNWENRGQNFVVTFLAPKSLLKYMVLEGSVTLNGVSLTISSMDRNTGLAQVSIIPHTWNNTVFKYMKHGEKINLEVDILAKYVENLLFHGGKGVESMEKRESKLSEDWLKSQGFWD